MTEHINRALFVTLVAWTAFCVYIATDSLIAASGTASAFMALAFLAEEYL